MHSACFLTLLDGVLRQSSSFWNTLNGAPAPAISAQRGFRIQRIQLCSCIDWMLTICLLCHSICVLESLPEPHILSEPTAALAQVVRHHLRNKITFWGLGDWTIRSAVPNIQLWEIALFGNNTWRRTKLGTPNPRNRGTLEKKKTNILRLY